jgi:hypothetical protein
LEVFQRVNGRRAPVAVGLRFEIAFAQESLLDFLISFSGGLLGSVVAGGDGGTFGFGCGGRSFGGGRGFRGSLGGRLGGGLGCGPFLCSGCLWGPRTNGEGREQGDRKRNDYTLQESSLHFAGACVCMALASPCVSLGFVWAKKKPHADAWGRTAHYACG